jgi:hypothetical protein
VDFALTTAAESLVGLDVRVDPPGAALAWQLFLDDAPWPDGATFTGPYGLPAVTARSGIAADDARAEVYAPALPFVDPARDLGVFVTRDRPELTELAGQGSDQAPPETAAAQREMQRVLQDWGYAHGSH